MDQQQIGSGVHVSHSQVQEFIKCPRKYHLHRRLNLEPEFVSSGLIFGSAMHEAIAIYHQARLEGREAEIDELLAAFEGCWAAEDLPIRYTKGMDQVGLQKKARAMLEHYMAEPHSTGDVLAIEEAFSLNLSSELPPVVGRIDLVESAADERLLATDFKTAKSRKAPNTDQLVLYREAAKALAGSNGALVRTRYVVLLKTKNPETVIYESEIGPGQIDRLCRTYLEVWEAIEAGVKHPRPGWWCGWCQWKSHCDGCREDLDTMF